jgi:hypothetical protein
VASLAIEGGTAREVGYLEVVAQDGAMTGYCRMAVSTATSCCMV